MPSYFAPTLYTGGGGNNWLYKPQILQGISDTLLRFQKTQVL